MHRSRVNRAVAFVLLALLALAVPTSVQAGYLGRDWERLSEEPTSGLRFLTKFWGILANVWAEAGGGLDPDGKVSPPLGSEGGGLDPDGKVIPPRGDEGSGLDPDGI
jgi:hypothetical protein